MSHEEHAPVKLFVDTETRSPYAIGVGTKKYSTGVDVIMATWSIDDGKHIGAWDISEGKPPEQLIYAAEEADEIWAHFSYFDRTMLGTTDWWPQVPLSKWRCTGAQALAHGLPGGLDKLCEIFRIDESKAKTDGKEYIKLFCKLNSKGAYNDWRSHPKEWAEFRAYAIRDIPAMIEVHKHMPKWNLSSQELGLWHLDQTINDRGFACDIEFAESAVRATKAEKKRLAGRTEQITDGFVERATQRDLLLGYLLLEYGVELPDLKADTIERRLEDPELPEYVKELLRIRLQATKASTAKYTRILNMQVDGRLYGTLQYCAANRTGRWGGRGFQPQNLPRPVYKFPIIEQGIEAFKHECEDLLVDDIMQMASSALRSAIVAAPGKKLVVSDLGNIEGRKIAWLAGEQWKLDAFAAYDRKEGPDLYKVAYARSFDVSPESVQDDSDERQIGKVMELALGYQGGVGAFVTMAVTYGVDLELMAEKAWTSIPPHILRHAQRTWVWASQNRRTLGLSEKVYVVCEALKILWRNAHPMTEALWTDYEDAARNAIQYPNTEFKVRNVVFDRFRAWLRIRLPSGRYLCYPDPKLEGGTVSYMGVNVYNKRWHRITTYGGKIAENITQASSRDVIADAMPRAESAGFPIVLTCHDEIMAEVTNQGGDDKELSRILSTNPIWALGLPLSAKGFTTLRYKKS